MTRRWRRWVAISLGTISLWAISLRALLIAAGVGTWLVLLAPVIPGDVVFILRLGVVVVAARSRGLLISAITLGGLLIAIAAITRPWLLSPRIAAVTHAATRRSARSLTIARLTALRAAAKTTAGTRIAITWLATLRATAKTSAGPRIAVRRLLAIVAVIRLLTVITVIRAVTAWSTAHAECPGLSADDQGGTGGC